MINVKKMSILATLFLTILLSTKAFAFGMIEIKDWQFKFSGNVNSFVVSTSCDPKNSGAVEGGLACGSNGTIGDNTRDNINVRTGLLPAWLGFRAERNIDELANNYKTGVTVGFQPGADDGLGGRALGANKTEFRQVFFDISSPSFGKFKIGRDLGLFGSDAILADMTLHGVGTVSDLTINGGTTSLGRIGTGYLYADWKAQAQYTTPDLNGLTFSIALVDPWQALGSGEASKTGEQQRDNIGAEGKVNYTIGNTKLWASFISQKVEFDDSTNYNASGFDVGVKFTQNNLELVGYYYSGEGIGTTAFLLDGSDEDGEKRDSDGFYVQSTYKVNDTKFGISYGESSLDKTDGESKSGLVKTNESVILGVYHSLNKALTLTAEYTGTKSESHNGNEAEEENFAVGGIMFF